MHEHTQPALDRLSREVTQFHQSLGALPPDPGQRYLGATAVLHRPPASGGAAERSSTS
mgnify:CR=1 FL=1